MRTEHPSKGFALLAERAHKSTVWGVRHLPQNRDLLVTTGGNGGVNRSSSTPTRRSKKDADGRAKGVPGTVELLKI